MTAETDPTVATDHSGLEDLRRRVAGTLHTPADPTWDAARTPWAVAVPQNPLAVLEVRDADDVLAAVRWALQHDRQVTAQPVGHGATGALDDVLLLRTRSLAGVEIDLERRTAWVGAGVKAGELLAALDGTGLVFLCGSNPDVSVVGMTLTGGLSWFGRAYGIAANSVRTVELVDGLGRVRTLSADGSPEEADLFWAVRGGGGDFGIVTRMEIALHPAPNVYGGRLLWPVERMGEVLRAFAAVTSQAPPELSLWYHTYQFPPFPEVPEPLRGKAFASVALAHLGDAAGAEELIAPLRAVPDVVMDLLGDVPVRRLGGIADEPTDPTPSLETSALLARLDDATIDALVAATGAGSRSALAVLQIRHLGGAFAGRDAGHGACGDLQEPYQLFAMGIPANAELVEAIGGTFGAVHEAVAGVSDGRTTPNFLGAHGDPAQAWSPAVRTRLGEVKDTFDPLGTIRSNRPVKS